MQNKKAFTLLEMILFIVVFSLGIVGVMTLYYNTLGRTSDPILRNRAVQVLQSVMEIVYSKKWDETTPNGGCNDITECNPLLSHIGPEAGETTIYSYDDVDDFVNSGTEFKKNRVWTSSDFGLSPGFQIYITVSYASVVNGKISENTSSKTNYKLIQLEVTGKGLKEKYKLIAVKANF